MSDIWYTHSNVLNSEVTEPKFTKFLHDVAESLPLLMRPSALRCINTFQNANAMNEGAVGNFSDFTPKLVAMTTSLSDGGKDQIVHHLRSYFYHLGKSW